MHREGISLIELTEMLPDEAATTAWFEDLIWPNGKRQYPCCGWTETSMISETSGLSYYLLLRLQAGFLGADRNGSRACKVPLREWVFAIY